MIIFNFFLRRESPTAKAVGFHGAFTVSNIIITSSHTEEYRGSLFTVDAQILLQSFFNFKEFIKRKTLSRRKLFDNKALLLYNKCQIILKGLKFFAII